MSWKAALKPYHLKLHFSNKYSYAQIVRQADGNIVAAASTIERELRESLPRTSDKEVSPFDARSSRLLQLYTTGHMHHIVQIFVSDGLLI